MKTRSEKNLKKINKLIKLCKKEEKDSNCIFTTFNISSELFYRLDNIEIYISDDADVSTGGGAVTITLNNNIEKSEYVMNFHLRDMDYEISKNFKVVYKYLEMKINAKNVSKLFNLKVKIGG